MITRLKLDRLAELRAEKDLFKIKKQEVIDSILTPEIKAQIAEIDEEFAPQIKAISSQAAEIEKRIKEEVIAHGETIKGAALQAVYSKGTRSWDLDKLDGYAVAHEEIKQFKKASAPSVSIRKV